MNSKVLFLRLTSAFSVWVHGFLKGVRHPSHLLPDALSREGWAVREAPHGAFSVVLCPGAHGSPGLADECFPTVSFQHVLTDCLFLVKV